MLVCLYACSPCPAHIPASKLLKISPNALECVFRKMAPKKNHPPNAARSTCHALINVANVLVKGSTAVNTTVMTPNTVMESTAYGAALFFRS